MVIQILFAHNASNLHASLCLCAWPKGNVLYDVQNWTVGKYLENVRLRSPKSERLLSTIYTLSYTLSTPVAPVLSKIPSILNSWGSCTSRTINITNPVVITCSGQTSQPLTTSKQRCFAQSVCTCLTPPSERTLLSSINYVFTERYSNPRLANRRG